MTNADLWKLDSNLPPSADFTIHSSYFSKSQDYQNGEVYQIFLIGTDQDDNPLEIRMAVGRDWTSADGGKTITHPTKRRIHKSSIYGNWINYAIAVDDTVEGRTLRERLFESDPMHADVWENLQLHLERTEISFGRGLDPREYLLPTKFLGIYEDQQLPLQSSSPTATVSTPTPQQLVEQARAATDNGSPLHGQMVELAKSSATFNDFLAAAFQNPDVLADDELARQVADEKAGDWSLR